MRILACCSLIITAAFAFVAPAAAAGPAWCAAYRNGSTNCGFNTYEQCLAAISGIGGFCNRNYIDGPSDKPAARKERKEREVEPKAKRKEKEEVKERVAPAPKPVVPPAAAQPAPVIVQPPPAPVAVQPAPAKQQANAFGAARALVLSGKYEAGIAAMKALGYDDHPDVASSIGFAYAKLGNLGEARAWYSKALAADPNHLTTWGYSGALFVAQGDIEKARRDLDRVKALCGGTTCREYQELDSLIAAKSR